MEKLDFLWKYLDGVLFILTSIWLLDVLMIIVRRAPWAMRWQNSFYPAALGGGYLLAKYVL